MADINYPIGNDAEVEQNKTDILSLENDKADLTYVDSQLAEKANKAQEAWITPTLLNGWVVKDGNVIIYRKDNFGKVTLQGAVSGGTATAIMNFPTGYRPSHSIVVPAVTSGGVIITLIINPTGNVVINTGVAGTYVDLSLISFFVA